MFLCKHMLKKKQFKKLEVSSSRIFTMIFKNLMQAKCYIKSAKKKNIFRIILIPLVWSAQIFV